MVEEMFSQVDTDGSGSLTANEIVGILTREGGGAPMSEQEARVFVACFDADGNGSLDYGEFVTAMQSGGLLGTWVVPAGQDIQLATPVAPHGRQSWQRPPVACYRGDSPRSGSVAPGAISPAFACIRPVPGLSALPRGHQR